VGIAAGRSVWLKLWGGGERGSEGGFAFGEAESVALWETRGGP
jgi:hypothetical protein